MRQSVQVGFIVVVFWQEGARQHHIPSACFADATDLTCFLRLQPEHVMDVAQFSDLGHGWGASRRGPLNCQARPKCPARKTAGKLFCWLVCANRRVYYIDLTSETCPTVCPSDVRRGGRGIPRAGDRHVREGRPPLFCKCSVRGLKRQLYPACSMVLCRSPPLCAACLDGPGLQWLGRWCHRSGRHTGCARARDQRLP